MLSIRSFINVVAEVLLPVRAFCFRTGCSYAFVLLVGQLLSAGDEKKFCRYPELSYLCTRINGGILVEKRFQCFVI